jgi:DNA gyrase subunit A
MEIGVVRRIDIDTEMQEAYLSYAMSVIVARALPDARDGLKPVHRRILYAMHDMGLRPDSPYKKSARIVGEVLGKYHPHGDAAVYEAMARMAQDFSMRYLLVDGQGNFGSIDGDAPAAMRYTEARLAAMAADILADIQKDTVGFTPNFDDTLTEPAVLPAAIPNLLVNGSSGIAVGMATSIPPHNLNEVCDALIYMLDRWQELDDVTVAELMRFIKGPDFPTGGVIVLGESSGAGLLQADKTKIEVESTGRGRHQVVLRESPPQADPARLTEQLEAWRESDPDLAEALADVRVAAERKALRVTLDLKRGVDPARVVGAARDSLFTVSELAAAYGKGQGRILVQAKADVKDIGRGRSALIVSELPYQVNKAALIERIADLARDGTLEGLADLRDESDREGMRIVIELSKTADPGRVIQELFRRTPMQGTFSIIMLALVNGEPRHLTLKQALRVYLDHRQEVVRRRTEHDLARARERAHILQGLLTALSHLDEVIRIIRGSRDTDEARARLTKRFKLSEIQANAILDMPLKRLAALERQKIQEEHKALLAQIKFLEGLLASPQKMRQVIQEELRGMKAKYGDKRRTIIVEAGAGPAGQRKALTVSELVEEEAVWVTITADGLLSRVPAKRAPKAPATPPLAVLHATTKDGLYLITRKGRAASLSVHAIPEREDPSEGTGWPHLSGLDANAQVVAAVSLSPAAPGFLFLGSEGGMVKKIALADVPAGSTQVFNVMNIAEGDNLLAARLTGGEDEILLVTANGQAIRFKEAEVRPMGLGAQGVMGIKIGHHEDRVVGLDVVKPRADALIAANTGQAKRTPLAQFPIQGRYGVGVSAWKLKPKEKLIGAVTGYADDRVTFVTERGQARQVKFDAAPRGNRGSRGRPVLPVKERDALARLVPALAKAEAPEPAAPTNGAAANGAGPKASSNGAGTKGKAPAKKKAAANGRGAKKKAAVKKKGK